MRTLTRLLFIPIALLALASPATGLAKDTRKTKPRQSHATLITAVSPTSISVRQEKTEKTVPITPATEIYVRDTKTNVDALQTGMAVNITLAMDGASASRISATDAPVFRDIPVPAKSKSKKRR